MKLKNKKYFQYKGKVHDLEIQSEKNDHSYNIENIVVHNSAVGSAVAYALGITSLNPIEHGLLFERFINPNRKQMPDIDWDQELGARDKVLEYLIETYGKESVCNVATFGTYGPKSALQDMSRGLRKDTGNDTILSRKIVKIPKLAEEGVNKWKPKDGEMISFFRELKSVNRDPDILDWIENNQDTIRLADKLCGQMKNLGTHAGGIVVTPEPIYNFIPVTRGSGNMITAFSEADGSEKQLSELGILKLDVLGLSTLNVLKECVEKIRQDTGEDLTEKINFLPLDDEKMIKHFATGNNYGIFQMDRSAMFTSRFREDGAPLDSFGDIVVINAMNRPGPLENFLPKYGFWKALDQGKIKISPEELAEIDKERYPFDFMRKSLSPTYGCLLFQEQFMQMICDVTGMTFGDADSFRRALAWKPDNPKFHTVKGYFDKLEQSMIDKGFTKEDVEKFLQYCRNFMGYSFNKCVSGKTVMMSHSNSGSPRSIGEFWKCMNVPGWAKRNGMSSMKQYINKNGYGSCFSLNEKNELVKNKIADIRFEGKKDTYTLELVTGETIVTTDNHKFPTSNGEKELKDIDIENDMIYVINAKMDTRSKVFPTALRKIKSITFKENEEVYDVEMEAPYHTFTVDTGIVTSNSHSVAYSYISWQTLFFKVYYPSYFYAAMLNGEEKTEKIQEIIEDARKNNIKVLNLSIVASEYMTKAEGPDAVRLGYKLIKGMGGAVENELQVLELHKCKTIDEVLQKPFKKVNSSALNNLIRLGCFDELGVARELIETLKNLYKEPKIEKWFTRKRSPGEEKTMPEILIETFGAQEVMNVMPDILDEITPHIALISRLTPLLKVDTLEKEDAKKTRLQKETINAEVELLGFAVSNDDAFGDFARSMKAMGVVSIAEWEEDIYCYFKIVKINEAKTKAGKTYWVYLLNDGRKDYKAKVWNMNKKAYDGAYCIGALDNDPTFGWTLQKCEIVK